MSDADRVHDGGSRRTLEAASRTPTRELILGDDTARVRIPEAWTIIEDGLAHHEIAIDDYPNATLTIRLHGFEDPAAVAADDISRYLIEPGHPAPRNVPTVPGCLFVTSGMPGDQRRHGDLRHAPDLAKPRNPGRSGDHGVYQRFYRQAEVLPPSHVRVLAATLGVPFGQRKDATLAALDKQVLKVMSDTRFAVRRTGLDRIAPSETWKRVSFWDVVHMRLPVDWWWNREHDDGTGMYLARDPTDDDGATLWVDYDQFESLEPGVDGPSGYSLK